jgi:DNA-binding CsgD family transcriptional regulator
MTFKITKSVLDAADEVAQGRLSYREIAKKCNVSERTISRWKLRREFKLIVKKQLEIYSAALRKQRRDRINEEFRISQEMSENARLW